MRPELEALGAGVVEVRGLVGFLERRRDALPAGPRRARVEGMIAALGALLGPGAREAVEGLRVLGQLLASLRLAAEVPGRLEARACATCADGLVLLALDGEVLRVACATCDAPLGEGRADRCGLPADTLAALPRVERRAGAAA